MAAKLLLPGLGGRYTSETFSGLSINSTGTDTLDCSKCGQLAIDINSNNSVGLSFQMQQSFAGSGGPWGNFGSALSGGTTNVFDLTDGPFGLMRIIASVTSGTASLGITGFPIQWSW